MTRAERDTEAVPSEQPRRRRKWLKRALIAAPFLGVAAWFGGPWLYVNVFRDPPPPELSFAERDKQLAAGVTTVATVASSELDGVWTITAPSTAGYRVKETIGGQAATAVGRTSTVDGSFTLQGATVTAAEINVDLATMTSDSDKRDEQFRGRIMSTEEFPVATFTLSEPVELDAIPADGGETVAIATGTLSLRGIEQPAAFTLQARRVGASVEIIGTTEIQFADFEIPDPSIGPVTTESRAVLEVSLTATQS
jgi:polyisoprenoid-binding protein YceI